MAAITTIVGFGASSMQGAGDNSGGGFFNRTQLRFAAAHPDVSFLNLGIGGNTTRDMLARRSDVEQISSRGLVVMLGCNDLPRDNDRNPGVRTTLEQYTANLRTFLDPIRGIRSLFISSFPVCPQRTGLRPETFDAYMTVALSVAAGLHYETWDLYRELLGTDLSPYWAPDGLHFNDAGHAVLAAGLASRLHHWF